MGDCGNHMSQADKKFRTIIIVESGRMDSNKRFEFRDDAIYIYSDADGYIRIVADAGIKLDAITTMQAGQQFNGSADGVVNFTKAGAITDADFTTDTTGLIGIDTTNDRIYYRIGAADWSFVTADGGFSFPEKTCFICGNPFTMGDEVKMVIDGFATDGAPHASPVHVRCRG